MCQDFSKTHTPTSKRCRATLATAVQKRAIVWSAAAKRSDAAALDCCDVSGPATLVGEVNDSLKQICDRGYNRRSAQTAPRKIALTNAFALKKARLIAARS